MTLREDDDNPGEKQERPWRKTAFLAVATCLLLAGTLAGCTGPPGGDQDGEDEHETRQDDEDLPHEQRDPSYAQVSISCDGLTCTFAGDAHLMNEEIDRHVWDFGDGNTSEHPVVDWTYEKRGNYSVGFTAYGKGGGSITEHDRVSVEAPGDQKEESGGLRHTDEGTGCDTTCLGGTTQGVKL